MAGDSFPDRPALIAQQVEGLQKLLQALIPGNRFYSQKLGGNLAVAPLTSLEQFCQFPFTTKSELVQDQETHPPFGSNLTFPLVDYCRYHQTSGTSGTPLRWLDTTESWRWLLDRWLEIFLAAQVTAGDRIVFAFSFGPFIGFWLAFEAATMLGALCLPAGGLSSVARLRLILDNAATVLCCTPTYALRLAEVAREEGIDLGAGKVKRIIVAGEAGGSIPATRKRLEELWPGARVFDHHGMTETGPVTFECPSRPGYLHIMESGFIPEVIDPGTSRPVAAGQTGELVLTTLGRVGSPLLRYRTGDLVKPELRDQPCACGRWDLTLEGGILGRVDDMVIVRGVNIYPSAVEDVLRHCGEIAEYHVEVSRSGALLELSLQIEPERDCRDVPALVQRVHKGFQRAFALRVPVQTVAPGSLRRFEMKAQRWHWKTV